MSDTASAVKRPLVAITSTSTLGSPQSRICSRSVATSAGETLSDCLCLHWMIIRMRLVPDSASVETRNTERSRPRSGAFVCISHVGFSYPFSLLISEKIRRSKSSAVRFDQRSFALTGPRGFDATKSARSPVSTGNGSSSP